MHVEEAGMCWSRDEAGMKQKGAGSREKGWSRDEAGMKQGWSRDEAGMCWVQLQKVWVQTHMTMVIATATLYPWKW